jgi:hypothetical protein
MAEIAEQVESDDCCAVGSEIAIMSSVSVVISPGLCG